MYATLRNTRAHLMAVIGSVLYVACSSVLGVEQRDRITHYAGDRYRRAVKYGDYGLKFPDYPKLTAMWR